MELYKIKQLKEEQIVQLQNDVREIDSQLDNCPIKDVPMRLARFCSCVSGQAKIVKVIAEAKPHRSIHTTGGSYAHITFEYKGECLTFATSMNGAYYSNEFFILRHKEPYESDTFVGGLINRYSTDDLEILVEGNKPNREGWSFSRFRKGEYLNFVIDNILKPLEENEVKVQQASAIKKIENKNQRYGAIDF